MSPPLAIPRDCLRPQKQVHIVHLALRPWAPTPGSLTMVLPEVSSTLRGGPGLAVPTRLAPGEAWERSTRMQILPRKKS